MKCPKCGSNQVNVQFINETTTETRTKGFGCIKAFCGYLLFSVPGILCGLCGSGKGRTVTRSRARKVTVCQNCGHQF